MPATADPSSDLAATEELTPAQHAAADAAQLQALVERILSGLDRVLPQARPFAARALWRAGEYGAARTLGSFEEIGRQEALSGSGHFLYQFAQVQTDADRLELLHQHRLWAGRLEAAAAARPIAGPARAPRERLRVGFLSSDLRHHVVAYFAQPLFRWRDPRFELFCYSSYRGEVDEAQRWIASRAEAFRDLPDDDRAAAAMIAADDLDLLIDLGGPTSLNRPGVLAYRPAPRQASWLGYPHSLCLAAIDDFITDPYMAPPRPDLLAERPLLMPSSWICLAPAAFKAEPAPAAAPPSVRNGYITFGTANGPHKFSPRLLRAWAKVVAATPGSRFMIVRPEGAAPVFRANIARHFAEEGVAAERLEFRAVRGGVLPIYGEIDIALDTFPLTGGTSTCEALWMGVPTVSLVGEAPYERLSWSILNNVGLEDLAAFDEAGYLRLAVALAQQPERLMELRRTLRARILARPIGQAEAFVGDFYAMLARTLGA